VTPSQYQSALTTLSLTPEQAAEWLGIGRSTAYRYLKEGAPGPVAVAIRQRLKEEEPARLKKSIAYTENWLESGACPDHMREMELKHLEGLKRFLAKIEGDSPSDLTAAVGLGAK